VEVVERPFEVVLELAANRALPQTAQARFIGYSYLRARTGKHYVQSGASRLSRSECGSSRKNRLDDGGVAERSCWNSGRASYRASTVSIVWTAVNSASVVECAVGV
jgi:hypothetical protein